MAGFEDAGVRQWDKRSERYEEKGSGIDAAGAVAPDGYSLRDTDCGVFLS